MHDLDLWFLLLCTTTLQLCADRVAAFYQDWVYNEWVSLKLCPAIEEYSQVVSKDRGSKLKVVDGPVMLANKAICSINYKSVNFYFATYSLSHGKTKPSQAQFCYLGMSERYHTVHLMHYGIQIDELLWLQFV